MRGVHLAHLTQLVEFYFVKREIVKQSMENVKKKISQIWLMIPRYVLFYTSYLHLKSFIMENILI